MLEAFLGKIALLMCLGVRLKSCDRKGELREDVQLIRLWTVSNSYIEPFEILVTMARSNRRRQSSTFFSCWFSSDLPFRISARNLACSTMTVNAWVSFVSAYPPWSPRSETSCLGFLEAAACDIC